MNVYQNECCWIIEDYLDINLVEKIKQIIQENLDNLYKKKEGYSTKGANVEQYFLTNSKNNFSINDSRFYEFEGEYRNQVFNRIKASDLFDKRREERTNLVPTGAWSVIGEENSYHMVHCHGEGNFDGISTLLYLEVPDTNIEDEPENNIFLITNIGPKNPYYHKNSPCQEINPEVGKLLIFPSWVLHGTYPQTKGIRQTFNIDYRIRLEEEKSKSLNYR